MYASSTNAPIPVADRNWQTNGSNSRLAACMVNNSGAAANVRYTGDPHAGQKPRVFTLPLSPAMAHCVALPVSFTSARRGKVR